MLIAYVKTRDTSIENIRRHEVSGKKFYLFLFAKTCLLFTLFPVKKDYFLLFFPSSSQQQDTLFPTTTVTNVYDGKSPEQYDMWFFRVFYKFKSSNKNHYHVNTMVNNRFSL